MVPHRWSLDDVAGDQVSRVGMAWTFQLLGHISSVRVRQWHLYPISDRSCSINEQINTNNSWKFLLPSQLIVFCPQVPGFAQNDFHNSNLAKPATTLRTSV